MQSLRMRRMAWLGLLLAPAGFAYIREVTSFITIANVPVVRVDNTAIQFFLNNQVAPGFQSSVSGAATPNITSDSNPQQAVHAALATWNAVGLPKGTANISFKPLQMTAAGIDSTDYQATIAFASTAAELSAVGGALAFTVDSYVSGPANAGSPGNPPVACTSNCAYPAEGDIFDSDIILNPQYTFSTTGAANSHDLQAVMLHELGHSLSANHTGLLGASMFQFPTNRFLTSDDIAFVNATYPLPTGATPLGTISGTVQVSGGGPAPYALLTAFDTSSGVTVGGVTDTNGNYSFQVPPGTYQIYAEPLNGVLPINIYLTAAQATQASAALFQATLFSGTLAVTANNTSTANITATSGASGLVAPYVAVSPVNGGFSSAVLGGPATIPSGGSVDLVLAGTGFDSTLTAANFTFYGPESRWGRFAWIHQARLEDFLCCA